MASVNYHVEYAKHWSTTISLFYTGRTGDAFSFVYNGNPAGYVINHATGATQGTYLAFLPQNKNDVIWQSEADWEAYKWFVQLNPEIQKFLGTHPKRSAANLPWNNRFDLRIAQEFRINVGNKVNRLQFSADILNVANLLNSNWGITKELAGTFQNFQILNYVGRDATTGKAIVSMASSGGDYVTTLKRDPGNQWTGSRPNVWAIQLGLRYTF
jgi:hypothetical protein